MRFQVQSLASLSGLRIQHCLELWCGLQMLLGSGVAVAGSCSSSSTPSLGTSICCGCSPKKQKKKPKTRNTETDILPLVYTVQHGLSPATSILISLFLSAKLSPLQFLEQYQTLSCLKGFAFLHVKWA